MNALGAGATLVVSLVLVVGGTFMTVLSVVSLVKVIQIAEDLRYIRSKSDLSVQRPKSWKNTLGVCLVASLIVIVLVGAFLLGNASALIAATR